MNNLGSMHENADHGKERYWYKPKEISGINEYMAEI